MKPSERASVLRRAGQVIQENHDELAGWVIRETGGIPAKTGLEVGNTAAECFEAAALPSRRRTPTPRAPEAGGVYVEGFTTSTKLANCCSPMRGDQIMGYLTRGRGVSVHRLDCPNMIRLLKDEPERCVAASWDSGTPGGTELSNAPASTRSC